MDDHDRILAAAHLAAALITHPETPGHVRGVSDEEWAVSIFERVYAALPAVPGMGRASAPPTP